MFNILEQLKDAKTICIVGHIKPDGDSVGSCTALYTYLKELLPNIEIDLYLEEIPIVFNILSNVDKINNNIDPNKNHDVFISLDCGALDRLGESEIYFKKAKKTINIDHHISNTQFAQVNYVDLEASSTCEVLFTLMEESKITLDIAKSIYTGIVHDTGVFRYSNTTKRTMKIAGCLIEKGVEFSRIVDESFYQKTFVQNQILGRCLLESILVLHGRCIVSTVTKKIMDFYGAKDSDLSGIIEQMRNIKGIEVAILIHEIDFRNYKVSMRSNGKVNVSDVASYFGGGGHVKAAGCSLKGNIYDVINNLTKHIEAQLVEK